VFWTFPRAFGHPEFATWALEENAIARMTKAAKSFKEPPWLYCGNVVGKWDAWVNFGLNLEMTPSCLDQVMVKTAVLDVAPVLAVMVALVVELTVDVLTVNVAEVLPAGMVTVAGAVADDWLLERVMTKPPVGAAEPMVTVPVDELPPETLVGFSVSDDNPGAFTVNPALATTPLRLAEIVADV